MTTRSNVPGSLEERPGLPRRGQEDGAAGRSGGGAGVRPASGPTADGLPIAAVYHAASLLRSHWPVAIVLALYALSALIVPTMTPAPVGDDWVYARSVEILLDEGRVEILDLSVVTLLFQVAWGALFALLFSPTFGALRLSTVVLVFLSAGAFYGLCRQLGIGRAWGALGTATYLFNPLAFGLAFSYMTDGQFLALLVISTYFYVRGLRPSAIDRRSLLAGSIIAALAFLVRQQGVLIPLAVVIYLLLARRLWLDRRGAWLFVQVVAIPALTTVLYYLWLRFIHGIPAWQGNFVKNIAGAGWGESRLLIERMTFIGLIYLGFFALPVTVAAILGARRLVRFSAPLGWVLFCAWEAVVVAGLAIFGKDGRWMPYIPQYLGPWGIGPDDLLGDRPLIVERETLGWLTASCAISSLVLGLALCRQVRARATPERAGAGLTLTIALWQAFGVLPPSFSFRNWIISLDRYLLPLLPFAICLGLWALRDVRLALPVAWLLVVAFAAFAVAGTRDFLTFQEANWDLARYANAAGVANTRLDAGASWDGYHLYEYSRDNQIPQQTPDRPWWVGLFAPATNSSYIVAFAPLPDYDVVRQVEYSSWLHREPTYLYLLRRQGVPGPP